MTTIAQPPFIQNQSTGGFVNLFLTALFCGLASPVASAEIQPLDGKWRHHIEISENKGCPPQLLGPESESFSYDIEYPKPFHPTGRNEKHTVWKKIGENQWHGVRTHRETGSPGEAVTEYEISVHSERFITQESTLTITVPGAIAKELGIKGGSCSVTSILEQHYSGN